MLRIFLTVLLCLPYSRGTFDTDDFEKLLVGAYYYPWHGNDFHRGGGYIRKEIGHAPALGEYDDSTAEVIQKHLEYSRRANIKLWVTSWWGRFSREDNTTRTVILPEVNGTEHKIALLYETTGILDNDDGSRQLNRVITDVEYILDTYVSHPNYFTVDDRPVLFVYLTRVLKEDLSSVMLLMRTAGSRRNVNLFLVGDQAFGVPPLETSEYLPFNFMDAITNYDNYGTLPKPYATNVGLEKYYRQQAEWRELARRQDCKFIPSVSPGYNDRGVRLEADHPPLSRKLNGASDDFGSFFRFSLRKAIPLIDRGVNRLIMVNSFNEWHEDTQIEPAIGKLTREPRVYTGGIEYEGYNTRYLDLLNRMTTNGSWIAEENFENEWLEQLINRKENKNTRPPRLPEQLRPNRRRRKRRDAFDSIEDNFNL